MGDVPHPPLDQEIAAVFDAWVAGGGLLASDLTIDKIPDLREAGRESQLSDLQLRHGGRVAVEERLIPGPVGAPDIPALILRPTVGDGPWPCIYFTNCGGKVVRGHRQGVTSVELDWVNDFGIVWVIVAPRVAPEDPHPAQVEDCYKGLTWVAEHASKLNISPDRIMVFGKSGGGGVAAATALLARDTGGPALTHQFLIYPMLDDREITVSSKYERLPWDRTSNRVGWSAMLGTASGGPDVSPYAAPSRAQDLSNLPPTYLETPSVDVFRDETIDYAARLAQAGVPVELHVWAGAIHNHESMAPHAEVSLATLAARTSYLRRALSTL